MTLTNSQITERVEELTKNIPLTDDPNDSITNKATIANIKRFLAENHTNQTIEAFNATYQEATGTSIDLIKERANQTPEDQQQITYVAMIQLRAIVEGFETVTPQTAAGTSSFVPPVVIAEPVETTAQRVNVHHYHHNQNNYLRGDDGYWRDWMLWHMLSGGNRGSSNQTHSSPPPPRKEQKDKSDEVSVAGILLAGVLLIGAFATIGYDIKQTYYRLNEINHNEDVAINTGKLCVTAFAAWQGYMLGAAVGAACFSNPVLGGLCAACIISAGAMRLSKWGAEQYHQSTNTTSALATDPRFCLSASDETHYLSLGRNPDVANEALRECAIAMKKERTNGLLFMQNPHYEIIELMRNIKKGNVSNKIKVNGKVFDLTLALREFVVYATPLDSGIENESNTPMEQTEYPEAFPVMSMAQLYKSPSNS